MERIADELTEAVQVADVPRTDMVAGSLQRPFTEGRSHLFDFDQQALPVLASRGDIALVNAILCCRGLTAKGRDC